MNLRSVRVVWAAMLGGVVMLGGVAWFMGADMRSHGNAPAPEVFSYVGIMMGLMGPAGGHVVRRVMGAQQQRFLLSFALAEGGALTGGVMFMLTGSPLALGGLIVGALGLASLYPSDPKEEDVVKLS
jgi:hypothetical protein